MKSFVLYFAVVLAIASPVAWGAGKVEASPEPAIVETCPADSIKNLICALNGGSASVERVAHERLKHLLDSATQVIMDDIKSPKRAESDAMKRPVSILPPPMRLNWSPRAIRPPSMML
jgi:hypothetical protein